MQFKILRGTLVLIKNCEYWGIWYFFDESINEGRHECRKELEQSGSNFRK